MATPEGQRGMPVTLVDGSGNAIAAPLQFLPFQTASFIKADVSAANSSGAWTTGNSPITLFTVTGLVIMRVYGRSTTLVTSTSNTGTLALGITGTTGLAAPSW